MRTLYSIFFLYFISLTFGIAQTDYEEMSWPKEIKTEKAVVTLYQPQLEMFEGNNLEGRMAVSISADDEMIFGAVWIKSVVSTDLEDRTVTLESIKVPKINFPELEDQNKSEEFSALLEKELESWQLVMSLDRLVSSMNDLEEKKSLSVQLDNTPPKIYYSSTPASLISIDGDPIYQKADEFDLEYVVNTPFFIVREKNKYYIKDGKFWYKSETVMSGYKVIDKATKNVSGFADKYGSEIELDSIQEAMTEAPALIISSKPAELISTDGEPDYKSIEGTGLLYASNTEDDIIMDIESQEHYILIAGRWYHSNKLKDGDWKFAEPEDLPADFANIPLDSDLANVRSSVPNTEEAQNALLEQSIPQTAQVDRATASVEVTYDGEPKFEPIEGTSMSYAVNTEKTVIKIDKKYYCIDDAIYFVSDKPTGPWEVSTVRPDEVDEIPPESPVYNVKYVYVYESTPEIVYVGYYPGYTYSYVYGGVVVYGTGYYYPYWYGAYYYPRPVTYGYGVHYNPYTGWGFSFGISVGWGYHPHGYWGARGYRYGYRRGYNRGYRRGYHHGYNRGYSQGAKRGYAAGKRSNSNNVYQNRTKGVNSSNRASTQPANSNRSNKAQASNKQNNMYTDRSGNVYQQNKDGSWDNKSNAKNKGGSTDKSNANKASTGNQASQNNKANASTSNKSNASTQNKSTSGNASSQNKSSTGNHSSTQNKSNTGSSSSQNKSSTGNHSSTQNKSSTSNRSSSSQQQLNRASQSRSQGNSNYNRSSTTRSSGGGSRGGGGGGRRR